MEENINTKSSMAKYILPVGILALIVIAAVTLYTADMAKTPASTQTPTAVITQPPAQVATTLYTDGTYKADGNYISPGGARDVGVTITLANDVITDATFEGRATDAPSMRFQKEFADNYKAMIVGKKIDDVMLTKVSGSSLTPKGFTDALMKVKEEAKS